MSVAIRVIGDMPVGSFLMLGAYGVCPEPTYAKPIVWQKTTISNIFVTRDVVEWLQISNEMLESESDFSGTPLHAFLNSTAKKFDDCGCYSHYGFLHCWEDYERRAVRCFGGLRWIWIPKEDDIGRIGVEAPAGEAALRERARHTVGARADKPNMPFWLRSQVDANSFLRTSPRSRYRYAAAAATGFCGVRPVCILKSYIPVVSAGLNIYALTESQELPINTDQELYVFLGFKH